MRRCFNEVSRMRLHALSITVSTYCLLLAAAATSYAYDVPVVGSKLSISARPSVDKISTSILINDAAVTKDSGTDPDAISATLSLRVGGVESVFTLPQGESWTRNNPHSAGFTDAAASGGISKSVITVGRVIKAKGPSLGTPAMEFSPDLSGPVYAIFTIVNDGVTVRHCTRFERDSCVLTVYGNGDYAYQCEGGVADPSCGP